MRRTLPVLLLAAIVLTGCGGTSTPSAKSSVKSSATPSTTTSEPAAMARWAGRFCSLDSQLSTGLPMEPIQPVGSPTEADRQDLLDYLQQAKAVLTGAKQAFAALSPAPRADANAMITSYRQSIDQALTNVNGDISSTTQASLADLELYFTLDPAAVTVFQADVLSTVSKAVKAHADLKSVFTGVPGCEVYTMGG